MKVLYSFPWGIGASGIGYTAWNQVNELLRLGVEVTLVVGSVARPFDIEPHKVIEVRKLIGMRVPVKLTGGMLRSAKMHDFFAARALTNSNVDVVHCWPTASLKTLKVASTRGIKTFLERPNSHTENAFEIAQMLERDYGCKLNKSHRFSATKLAHEVSEYDAADYLLCPSDYVKGTFVVRGYDDSALMRHQYGYNPPPQNCDAGKDFGVLSGDKPKFLFVGHDPIRKGLMNILEAWFESSAHDRAELHVVGDVNQSFILANEKCCQHPSVYIHGVTNNAPAYFLASNYFVLSSFEEGSALVTYEAIGMGCVPLVSSSTGAPVKHMETALVHEPGDIKQLASHFDLVLDSPAISAKLREAAQKNIEHLTWKSAGRILVDCYDKGLLCTT